jgi:hypothetical protein
LRLLRLLLLLVLLLLVLGPRRVSLRIRELSRCDSLTLVLSRATRLSRVAHAVPACVNRTQRVIADVGIQVPALRVTGVLID